MNVGELIKRLEKLDPETVVVKLVDFGGKGLGGYDECHFIDGSHQYEGHREDQRVKRNPKNSKKGAPEPDYLHAEGKSRARKFKVVLIS